MRKFSFKTPNTPTSQPVQLSVEEEAILADEKNEQQIESEQTTNDIEQMGDIIVKMGDVQTIVSNIPEIKPIDQALVGAVAEAAVAGTDADPEEVAGSMLPDQGVSTESFIAGVKGRMTALQEKLATLKAAQ